MYGRCERQPRCMHFLAVALAGYPLAMSASPPVADYPDYLDWLGWSRVGKNTVTGLASSYDRLDGNADYSQYESPPGYVPDAMPATIATLDGPGVIYRFWMPHATANQNFLVKLFFDGEPAPRIDTTSSALLGGSYGYFDAPLVDLAAGGQTCYEPIPFAHSLRIETFNQQLPPSGFSVLRHYYQYTYRLFPQREDIQSYDGALDGAESQARAALIALFASAGTHPAGDSPATEWLAIGGIVLSAGQEALLADLVGPGVVRQVNYLPGAATDAELQALRLKVRYDEDAAPAIDASLADFFGAGQGREPYASLPLGTESIDGFYSYWPMPFHRRIQVALYNAGAAPILVNGAKVAYENAGVAVDSGYLHCKVQSTVRSAADIYHPILDVSGRGHYVGSLLYLRQDSFSFAMLEGDDQIFVDDQPPILGTGLEDAYNGGYYYNWVLIQPNEPEGPSPRFALRPLHGILYVNRDNAIPIARADQYRWLIGDRVPFAEHIDVRIENRYGDVGGAWTSVAFWYQQPKVRGDADNDGDLDLLDIASFQLCYPDYAGGCGPTFDLDNDADVDPVDFVRVCASVNGPW